MKNLRRSAGWLGRGACIAGLVSIGGFGSAAVAGEGVINPACSLHPAVSADEHRPTAASCSDRETKQAMLRPIARVKVNPAPHVALLKRPPSNRCAATGDSLCVEAKAVSGTLAVREYVWNIRQIGSADFRGTAF